MVSLEAMLGNMMNPAMQQLALAFLGLSAGLSSLLCFCR
jgi:hypothetical protein